MGVLKENKTFKGFAEAKLLFPEGWRGISNLKNLLWEGFIYFLEQQIFVMI